MSGVRVRNQRSGSPFSGEARPALALGNVNCQSAIKRSEIQRQLSYLRCPKQKQSSHGGVVATRGLRGVRGRRSTKMVATTGRSDLCEEASGHDHLPFPPPVPPLAPRGGHRSRRTDAAAGHSSPGHSLAMINDHGRAADWRLETRRLSSRAYSNKHPPDTVRRTHKCSRETAQVNTMSGRSES